MQPASQDPRAGPVAVIGAGVAGLITAHTLIRDGFDVHILTRDAQVGGVWERDRIYPGLYLNHVHGEYRLSPLKMPPSSAPGGRLTGEDVANYVDAFARNFLQGKIQFDTDVRNIRRSPSGGWLLDLRHLRTGVEETRTYARLVVCSGGCSSPHIPSRLSREAATAAGYKGLVFHSADFSQNIEPMLSQTSGASGPDRWPIVVIGGGKSAQDICAFLANEGRDVTMVCHRLDAFTAAPKPPPNFLRRSRLASLLSPHIHLRTSIERFLHTTWVGKRIVDSVWRGMEEDAFRAANIPRDSPLRNTVRPFWHIRVNDEGVPRPNGFHALAAAGKIKVLTPAHAVKFGDDGLSVVLGDGSLLRASTVVLATGYKSSWSDLFDRNTIEELGLDPQPANTNTTHRWDYTTLSDPPPTHPDVELWASHLINGLVPAKNIARRDFAVNGACVTANNAYTVEVASHWISSYFLGDEMRIPKTPEAALAAAERQAAWLKRRYPEIPSALHPSHTAYLAFWTWPQHVDDMLEDMGLPIMRSGGNIFTWPFKVIDSDEIQHLKEERDARRATFRA